MSNLAIYVMGLQWLCIWLLMRRVESAEQKIRDLQSRK
jgi:hypothetical protein